MSVVAESVRPRALLKVTEISVEFAVSRGLVMAAIRCGQLPARRIGGLWFAHRNDAERLFRSSFVKR